MRRSRTPLRRSPRWGGRRSCVRGSSTAFRGKRVRYAPLATPANGSGIGSEERPGKGRSECQSHTFAVRPSEPLRSQGEPLTPAGSDRAATGRTALRKWHGVAYLRRDGAGGPAPGGQTGAGQGDRVESDILPTSGGWGMSDMRPARSGGPPALCRAENVSRIFDFQRSAGAETTVQAGKALLRLAPIG